MSEPEALFGGELEDLKPKDEEEHSDQDMQTLLPIINTPVCYPVSVPVSTQLPKAKRAKPSVHTPVSEGHSVLSLHMTDPEQASIASPMTQPTSSTCAAVGEAITLKLRYICLIKELHNLLVSGAISCEEYQLQKNIILGQTLAL